MGWIENTAKPETEITTMTENPFVNIGEIQKNRGLKILVYGLAGSGKTHFSLTAPGPIYFIDSERAVTLLKDQFGDKEISVVEAYESNPKDSELDDVAVYERIIGSVDYLYKNKIKEGTVVIDSITDFWKICQNYAKVKLWKIKKTDRVKFQFEWGTINDLYNQLINKLLHLDLNVVLTAKAQQVYGPTGQPTTEYAPHCQKNTEYLMDITVFQQKSIRDKKLVFGGTINKCRANAKLMNQEIENLSFDSIVTKLEEK